MSEKKFTESEWLVKLGELVLSLMFVAIFFGVLFTGVFTYEQASHDIRAYTIECKLNNQLEGK